MKTGILLLLPCLLVVEATGVLGKRLRSFREERHQPHTQESNLTPEDFNLTLATLDAEALGVENAGAEEENLGDEELGLADPDVENLGDEDLGDEKTRSAYARGICYRGLVNTCSIKGGICVSIGKCKRKARVLSASGCQSCNCCPGPTPVGCAPQSQCSRQGGVCSTQCSWNTIAYPGLCSGEGCLCCVASCPLTQSCWDLKGKCVMRSDGCAGTVKTGICQSSQCVCCVPPTQTSPPPVAKPCPTKKRCEWKGGVCKWECSKGEEEDHTSCGHKGCVCCVKKRQQCKTSDKCQDKYGTCKEECHEEEYEDQKLCEGDHCKCCYK